MLKYLVFYTLMTISMIHIIHVGLYIVGANIYDIKGFLRGSKAKKSAYNPLVSIVIPAHNEETGVVPTVRTVLANYYKNIEIIIVDDGSTDNTRQNVREYIQSIKGGVGHIPAVYMARRGRQGRLHRQYIRRPTSQPRIVLISQENEGKGTAVNNGIQNHARGELIMTLDADSLLNKDAIGNAVRYFEDGKVLGVAANVQIMDNGTALSMLQKIEHLISYRSKKFYTITNCEMVVGGVASTYRASVLKQVGYYDTDTITEDLGLSMKIVAQHGNKDYHLVYAADVVAHTEPVYTYKALFRQRYRWKQGMLQNLVWNRQLVANRDSKYTATLTAYRVPMAFLSEAILLVEPLVLLYLLYLSFQYLSFGAFIGAYGLLTLYVLWTLVPDEHLSVAEKTKYCLMAPLFYFLFYVMTTVQLAAVILCIWNYKKVFGIEKVRGIWVSPERASVPS